MRGRTGEEAHTPAGVLDPPQRGRYLGRPARVPLRVRHGRHDGLDRRAQPHLERGHSVDRDVSLVLLPERGPGAHDDRVAEHAHQFGHPDPVARPATASGGLHRRGRAPLGAQRLLPFLRIRSRYAGRSRDQLHARPRARSRPPRTELRRPLERRSDARLRLDQRAGPGRTGSAAEQEDLRRRSGDVRVDASRPGHRRGSGAVRREDQLRLAPV